MSSRRSGMQPATRGEDVLIGVFADPSPHLLVSTSRRLGTRTARPKTRLCPWGSGSRFGAHSRRQAVLKTFPHGPPGTRSLDWPQPPDRGPTDPPQPGPWGSTSLELPNKLTAPPQPRSPACACPSRARTWCTSRPGTSCLHRTVMLTDQSSRAQLIVTGQRLACCRSRAGVVIGRVADGWWR